MRSKTITLILEEGTPYGLRTLQMKGWNGKMFVCGRSTVKKLKDLEEASLPAAYILIGDGEVYVGETDTLGQRLTDHVRGKDFWHDLVAFTSPDLQKTEVKYLEHLLADRVAAIKKAKLLNGAATKSPTICKEIKDGVDEYLERAMDVLLSIGVDILGTSRDSEAQMELGVTVYCKGPKADANGYWNGDTLIVKKGSVARIFETPTIPAAARGKRAELANSGLLRKLNDDSYELTGDYLATSPSNAADVILGRSANGLTEWRTKEGKTLKEMEK